ncbi:hypothetical protein GCM10009101_06470 [Brevundimonas lenta]
MAAIMARTSASCAGVIVSVCGAGGSCEAEAHPIRIAPATRVLVQRLICTAGAPSALMTDTNFGGSERDVIGRNPEGAVRRNAARYKQVQRHA